VTERRIIKEGRGPGRTVVMRFVLADVQAEEDAYPVAGHWPGIAPGRTVAGPLIRLSDGTPRVPVAPPWLSDRQRATVVPVGRPADVPQDYEEDDQGTTHRPSYAAFHLHQ
jgi:hypothetical protein